MSRNGSEAFPLQRRAGFPTRHILILMADWKVRPPVTSNPRTCLAAVLLVVGEFIRRSSSKAVIPARHVVGLESPTY